LDYINSSLGGLRGHPIAPDICQTDGTAAKAIACANQFVQNNDVAVLALQDGTEGDEYPILAAAHIPLVESTSQSAQTTPNVPYNIDFFAPQEAFAAGTLEALKALGGTKVTISGPQVKAVQSYNTSVVAPAARALGITFTPEYFSVTAPNYQVLAAATLATNPNAAGWWDALNSGMCDSLITSYRQAGFKGPLLAGSCDATSFIKDVGRSLSTGIVQFDAEWTPVAAHYAPPQIQSELTTATTLMNKYKSKGEIGDRSYEDFAQIVTFAQGVNSGAGPVTAASVYSTLQGLKNFQAFLGPSITCGGSVWPNSDSCSNQIQFLQVQSDGSLKPVLGTGGSAYFTVTPPS
jgi:branched-chain amino acid transport system substrate-binding protein